MDSKTTLSISEARKKIFKIAEDVQSSSKHYTLTERGKPKIAIISAEEYESWQETLEVVKDFPDIKKEVKEAEEEYMSGKTIKLKDALKKEGIIFTDENVQNSTKKDIRKRTK